MYDKLSELKDKRARKDKEIEIIGREVQELKKIVNAAKEGSSTETPTKKNKERKSDKKRTRKAEVKEEASWHEMSPEEEQGALKEMKGRNREQREEDKAKLRTAIVADMMRRVTELANGMRNKQEGERDEEFVDSLEQQMKKSMDVEEICDLIDKSRRKIGIKEWSLDHVRMRKELRVWITRMRDILDEEQEEEKIKEISRNRVSKIQEVKREVKVETEADFGESSGEEKDWDREVQVQENHTDGSDREQCLWEKDHGQPETDPEDILSDLSENEVQTKCMLVEICCSEKSRLTDQARKKNWKGVRVTQRNNVYRPRTMRKLRKLLGIENLRAKGIERVHSHLSLPCTPFQALVS